MFLSENFKLTDWASLEPYYKQLADMPIHSTDDLKLWLRCRSEIESLLEEDMAWRYVRMTCDTTNKEREQAYLFFVSEIEPKVTPYSDILNRKMMNCGWIDMLNETSYFTYIRRVRREIELYREENIPLQVEIQTLAQKYGAINGAMTIDLDGQTLTLQQAANEYKNTDREKRRKVFELISERRLQDAEKLEDLYDELLKLRHQVAVNAGYSNFRDYMFAAMGRFDYTVADCENFHHAIALNVVPLVREMDKQRKKELGYTEYKPWDTAVDTGGRAALKPFEGGQMLLEKTLACFEQVDEQFKQIIQEMDKLGHFDLDSRIGKAPGGYNYPMAVTGYPFIFMNAAGNTRDVETMVHEAGHAFHSVLSHPLELNAMKQFPSEVAELASMSMELISSEGQHVFYPEIEDYKRAQREHLEGIIEILPWIATVDKFQHWIYTNPTHTREERKEAWLRITAEFSTGVIDWTGYDHIRPYGWHKQLHIFEVPFYYIEYGIAQLGAVGVWKNYLSNPKEALKKYKTALSLGYSRTLPEIYATAGVPFNFESDYISELMQFVRLELEKL